MGGKLRSNSMKRLGDGSPTSRIKRIACWICSVQNMDQRLTGLVRPALMPTIYRIEDSGASARTGMDASLAAAITFEGKKTGTLMPGEYLALLVGDEIKALPH